MSSPRRCASCAVCCTALAIEALDKPAGVPCEHLNPGGTYRCKLHGTAKLPEECAAFHCAWSLRVLPSRLRPDDAGVVVSLQSTTLGRAYVIHEEAPDSINAARAFPTVTKVIQTAERESMVVFRMGPDGARGIISRGAK